MAKRAVFSVIVEGTNISSALAPVLHSLSVSDSAGTHGATASLEIDDTDARIVLPKAGASVSVLLGWQGGGIREVFAGTMDEIWSEGTRDGGRRLLLSAKGFDATGKAKEGQQRHWDDATVEDILTEAGEAGGIDEFEIDPDLAEIEIPYFEMHDESFLHMGGRLAREIGGNFRVRGDTAIMSKRGGDYSPLVMAAWGRNLHAWNIAPTLGRARYGAARSRWYDPAAAEWKETEADTELDAEATYSDRMTRADEGDAERQSQADGATSERDAGAGSVTIEGDTGAVPDGLCAIAGARPGVDGVYRIESVTHHYSRGGGWITSLELKEPQDGAGDDSR